MTKDAIIEFIADWPKGNQLNMYLDNGFSVVCTRRSQVASVNSDAISGKDFSGRPYCVPMEHISLLTFRPEGDIKKNK